MENRIIIATLTMTIPSPSRLSAVAEHGLRPARLAVLPAHQAGLNSFNTGMPFGSRAGHHGCGIDAGNLMRQEDVLAALLHQVLHLLVDGHALGVVELDLPLAFRSSILGSLSEPLPVPDADLARWVNHSVAQLGSGCIEKR
jgi:hypothetical protein